MGIESFLADIDRMNQQHRHNREIQEEQVDYAGAASTLRAVIAALEDMEPDHPLLTSEALKAARSAGENAFRRNPSWDAARQAGLNYYKSLNYRPKAQPDARVSELEQENAALKARLEELEAVNVQNYAEKVLYRKAVRITNKEHPVLIDPFVISAVRKMAMQTYAFTKSYDEVSKAVEDYRLPAHLQADRMSLETYRGEEAALRRRIESLNDPKHLEILRRLREREDSTPK